MLDDAMFPSLSVLFPLLQAVVIPRAHTIAPSKKSFFILFKN